MRNIGEKKQNKKIVKMTKISFCSSDAEYFASANLNSVEDVATAIESCKKNILETTENTPRQVYDSTFDN